MKKILAALLCTAMVICFMPAMAWAAEGNVATVNGIGYPSLQAAFAAVPADTETTVTLESDISDFTTADIATVEAGKNVLLDMAGHHITTAGTDSFTGSPIINRGTLRVTGNGTIDSTGAALNGYGAIRNFGILTIENGIFAGNVKAKGAAIKSTEGKTTINGGDFTGTCAVDNDEASELVINNGNFHTTSASCDGDAWSYCVKSSGKITFNNGNVVGVQGGIAIKGGQGTINGGTFKTVACSNPQHTWASFFALYVAGEENTAKSVINGGSFTSESRSAAWFGNNNADGDGGIRENVTITINGGIFNSREADGHVIDVDHLLATLEIKGGTFNKKEGLLEDKAGKNIVTIKSDENVKEAELSNFVPAGYDVIQSGNSHTVSLHYVPAPTPSPDVPKTETTTKPDGSTTTTTTHKDSATGVESKTEVVKDKDGSTTAKAEVSAPAKTTTSGTTATAEISKAAADKLVEKAKAAEKAAAAAGAKEVDSTVTIETSAAPGAAKVETVLPADAVKQIAAETSADLKVVTPAGEVTLDNKALNTVAGQAADGAVKVTVEKIARDVLPEAIKAQVDDKTLVLDLSVETASGKISSFGGGSATVCVELPAVLGDDAKVMFINEKGEAEEVQGQVVTISGKKYFQFTTEHFSYYALADGATVDAAVKATEKARNARIEKGVKETAIKASSKAKKGSITIKWKKSAGFKVDCYQVFRSVKKNKGYGAKALYTTKNGTQTTYKNTKAVKKGTRYYYKVRGIRVLDGKKVYTKWSNKADQVAK